MQVSYKAHSTALLYFTGVLIDHSIPRQISQRNNIFSEFSPSEILYFLLHFIYLTNILYMKFLHAQHMLRFMFQV